MFLWPGGAGTRRLGPTPPQVPLVISTRWGLSAPLLMSLQSPSQVAPAMGVPVVALLCPCGQSAQPLDLFFEQVGGCKCLPVGLPSLGEFVVIGVIISQSSSRNLLSVVGSLFSISFWHGSTLCSPEALFHGGQDVLG